MVIRFVDSNFHGQATTRELAEIFPSAADISIEPIPLRSIFLAIAKNGRTALRKTEEGKAET